MAVWLGKVLSVVVRHGPKAIPFLKDPAKDVTARARNRQKAISHARNVDGRFGEVWIGQDRYWIVEKNGELLNTFPPPEGPREEILKAMNDLAPHALMTYDQLLRSRARERLHRKRSP